MKSTNTVIIKMPEDVAEIYQYMSYFMFAVRQAAYRVTLKWKIFH